MTVTEIQEYLAKHPRKPLRWKRPGLNPPPAKRGMEKPLLGTRLKMELEKLGITQEWYIANKKSLGLPPTCNCDKRITWLNNVHRKWLKWLKLDQPGQID